MKAQFIYYTLCIVMLFSSEVLSLTPEQRAHEKQLTELAKERCDTEQVEGKDFSVKLIGDGKVEVSFFGKKGGEVKGTFIFTKSEWEGRQRVLKEHQAQENKDRRKCIREELDSLRKSYKPPKDESPPAQTPPLQDSEISKIGSEWMAALKAKDVEKLTWLSDTPFFFDGMLLLTPDELKDEYRDLVTGIYDDGTFSMWRFIGDPREKVIVKGMSVGTLEQSSKKAVDLNKAIQELKLNWSDSGFIVDITLIEEQHGGRELDLTFFILINKTDYTPKIVGLCH
jgi:hypothetical protein